MHLWHVSWQIGSVTGHSQIMRIAWPSNSTSFSLSTTIHPSSTLHSSREGMFCGCFIHLGPVFNGKANKTLSVGILIYYYQIIYQCWLMLTKIQNKSKGVHDVPISHHFYLHPFFCKFLSYFAFSVDLDFLEDLETITNSLVQGKRRLVINAPFIA